MEPKSGLHPAKPLRGIGVGSLAVAKADRYPYLGHMSFSRLFRPYSLSRTNARSIHIRKCSLPLFFLSQSLTSTHHRSSPFHLLVTLEIQLIQFQHPLIPRANNQRSPLQALAKTTCILPSRIDQQHKSCLPLFHPPTTQHPPIIPSKRSPPPSSSASFHTSTAQLA